MKKSISTQLTPANITAVSAILTVIPDQLARLSSGLDVAQLKAPLGEGERSFTEDLAHLINCEARSAESIYLALLADAPDFINIHPERQWGKLLRYEQFEFAELLVYFTFRRRVLLNVLHGLTEEQWARVICEAGKQRKESVYWRARSLALHEHEHVIDLENKLLR